MTDKHGLAVPKYFIFDFVDVSILNMSIGVLIEEFIEFI